LIAKIRLVNGIVVSVEADVSEIIDLMLRLGEAAAGATPKPPRTNVTPLRKTCSECGSPSKHKKSCSKGKAA